WVHFSMVMPSSASRKTFISFAGDIFISTGKTVPDCEAIPATKSSMFFKGVNPLIRKVPNFQKKKKGTFSFPSMILLPCKYTANNHYAPNYVKVKFLESC